MGGLRPGLVRLKFKKSAAPLAMNPGSGSGFLNTETLVLIQYMGVLGGSSLLLPLLGLPVEPVSGADLGLELLQDAAP